MAQNRGSLSEQAQRRGNRVLLIIGGLLLLLFLLAFCQMANKKKVNDTGVEGDGKRIIDTLDDLDAETETAPVFKRGDAILTITPDKIAMEKVVLGSISEAALTLRAENAPIKIKSKKLAEEKADGFQLSGPCMEKDYLEKDESCILNVSWHPETLHQIQNTLTIVWIEDNAAVFDEQKSIVSLIGQSTDSKDCIICKCDEKEAPPVPQEAATITGGPAKVEKDKVIIDGKEYTPKDNVVINEKGELIAVVQPKTVPLSLNNDLLGTVKDNRTVIDFDGNKIGRLLGDDTIINDKFEVIGKAIDMVPVMKENGEVIGKMKVNGKAVDIVDGKDRVIGRPRVDGQVMDLNGKHLGYLSPWGLVMDFQGKILGGIYPDGKVISAQNKVIGYMRPMGLAVSKNGGLIGGVVPRGVVVGPACKSYGAVAMNGQVMDGFNQNIGHVLLDKTVVNAQMAEVGSVVRQGLIIDSASKMIGFVNSAGKAVNMKGELVGCVNPDGTVFAKDKFIGSVMPQGRVIREACGQVGSVYPDAQVKDDDVKVVGRVYPDGDVQDDKRKYLGMVAPTGTVIGPDCQLLGLISPNGTVVSPEGLTVGCITRTKEVLNVHGDLVGQVTPMGLLLDDQNKTIGRVGLDGQIYNGKGEVLGCVNSTKKPQTVLSNKGVIIDENGRPTGWTLVGGKAYDSANQWMGDVYSNGCVIGSKHQLVGYVPKNGIVFSDHGEVLGYYDQLTGMTTSATGEILGRVLPGQTVVNESGTEIVGTLISEGTTFVDLDGLVVGSLQPDGTIKNQNNTIQVKVYANGTLLNEEGKFVGSAVRSGPVLSVMGKYMGLAKGNGEVVDSNGKKVGRLLPNGLAVTSEGAVLGKVFSQISIPVSVEGTLGAVKPQLVGQAGASSYQGQVNDSKGNVVGMVSAGGAVLGNDNNVKGYLVDLNVVVNDQGRLIGWANFAGEMNNPDGRTAGVILPSGVALGSAQEIQGQVVPHTVAVDTMGQFLGAVSSRGEVLSEKGEVLSHVGSSQFLYDDQGILVGRLLAPGIALDNNAQMMGWTRYDGQIENGTKILGTVGLDGHVFDADGLMIGYYLPLGMVAFSDSGKTVGLITESGMIRDVAGNEVAKADSFPYIQLTNGTLGRFIDSLTFVSNFYSGQVFGALSTGGQLTPVASNQIIGQGLTNTFASDNSAQVMGGFVKKGLATATTLGSLGVPFVNGQIKNERKLSGIVAGNNVVFSPKGEVVGGVYTPSILIDKKGAYAGSTGSTSGVFVKGRQIGHKLAFNSAVTPESKWIGNTLPKGTVVGMKGEFLGSIAPDGSVIKPDGSFLGQILPDGTMAQVGKKGVLNTMPYGGHTVAQGLAFGYKKQILGRTTDMGDIIDLTGKKITRILDTGLILGTDQPLSGVVLPFMTATGYDGGFVGTLTSSGDVLTYQGEVAGPIANNGTVKGNNQFHILGALVPEPLVVNDCKVIGQTAYDGRIINGQGSVVGRIRPDKWGVDAQGKEIGRTVRTGSVMSETGDYLGRTLPDSTVVDLNGVEIACAKNDGSVVSPDGKTWGHVVESAPVFDDQGNMIGYVNPLGQLVNEKQEVIGKILGDGKGTAVDFAGRRLGRVLDPLEELVLDKDGKLIYTIHPNGEIRNPKGDVILRFDPTTGKDPWIPETGQVCPSMVYLKGVGCLQGCDLIGPEGKMVASIKADGTMRDENNDIYATLTSDGKVSAPNGSEMGEFIGVRINFEQCGIASGQSGRTLIIGGNPVKVENGTIVDEEGNILGYMGENGRPFTLEGKPMTQESVTGRVRPPEPKAIKVDPEQVTAIQEIMKKKRQSMRESLGKGTLLIPSKELLARGKPKKDKDWSSIGIGRGRDNTSTWSVDMTRVVLQGKAISAVLARSIDSRFGDVDALAIVDTNVYAEEGRNIVIPAGSRLIGRYNGDSTDSHVSKVGITWDRLIRPDGSAFNLNGSPSGDAMGRGGVAAYLDKRLWDKYGNPVLGTLTTNFIMDFYAKNEQVPASDNAASQDGSTAMMSEQAKKRQEQRKNWIDLSDEIMEKMIEEGSNTPTVLYVPAGTRLTVILNQDLWLRSPEDDEEDVNSEFGEPTTQAQRPTGIPETATVRKQRQGLEETEQQIQPTKPQRNAPPQPIYNGEEEMPEDLSDRVVTPVTPAETAPIF